MHKRYWKDVARLLTEFKGDPSCSKDERHYPHDINSYLVVDKTNYAIHWIVIYSIDITVINLLNNLSQMY